MEASMSDMYTNPFGKLWALTQKGIKNSNLKAIIFIFQKYTNCFLIKKEVL